MADMSVKLYNMPRSHDIEENLSGSRIKIKKALTPDRSRTIAFSRICAKSAVDFYKKCVGAIMIDEKSPGVP